MAKSCMWWLVLMVVGWLAMNVLITYHLHRPTISERTNHHHHSSNRRNHQQRDMRNNNSAEATGGEVAGGRLVDAHDSSMEIEPEDSDSSGDASSQSHADRPRSAHHHHRSEGDVATQAVSHHNHRSHDASSNGAAGPNPGAPKHKKASDSIPRSVGNSVAAAVTKHVTIRSDDVRFLIVGDWGGPGHEPQRNVAKAMDTVATLPKYKGVDHSIHFVVSTGDNMYEDGVSSIHDPKFKRNFESVYSQPSLQCRWYMSLGNHDHGAHGVMRNAQVEVNYTQVSNRWYLPSTYYSQSFHVRPSDEGDHHNGYKVQLIVLDTYDYSPRVTQMTSQQLKWFEETLASSNAHVKIVVGHRPLYSAGAKHGSSPYMQKRLEPLLIKYGVTAYLCGDDHELQVMRSNHVVHLLSGGGSRAKKDLKPKGVPQTLFQAGVHGFMWASVNKTMFSVEVYNQRAEILYQQSFPTRHSHTHAPK